MASHSRKSNPNSIEQQGCLSGLWIAVKTEFCKIWHLVNLELHGVFSGIRRAKWTLKKMPHTNTYDEFRVHISVTLHSFRWSQTEVRNNTKFRIETSGCNPPKHFLKIGKQLKSPRCQTANVEQVIWIWHEFPVPDKAMQPSSVGFTKELISSRCSEYCFHGYIKNSRLESKKLSPDIPTHACTVCWLLSGLKFDVSQLVGYGMMRWDGMGWCILVTA